MGESRKLLEPVLTGLVAACLGLSAVAGAASAETLRISGTGGALGGIARVAHAFQRAHPGVRVVIPRSVGSVGGIQAAIAGKLDIGVSARPLTREERARGGQETPYARTAFVFAVNPDVDRSDITLDEAAAIYGGRLNWWGNGTPVRVVLRPAADTDSVLLRRMGRGMAAALAKAHGREGMIMALTDTDCADRIESVPGAFGTTTLALVLSEGRKIKVLSLGGVAPSNRSVTDGSYPYSKTFHLVTGARPRPAAVRFIDFLRSPGGMSILLRAGQVPVP